MVATDTAFAGSIPEYYHRCLGPFLFEPYAEDLARRARELGPRRILETAAGTGIVTAALARALPEAEILATDLNPDMLRVAEAGIDSPRVRFAAADAQSLGFEEGGFDLVVCQFGAMFFPDRVAAYREALRMLRPGGAFLFNVWDRLDANPASQAVAEAVAGLFRTIRQASSTESRSAITTGPGSRPTSRPRASDRSLRKRSRNAAEAPPAMSRRACARVRRFARRSKPGRPTGSTKPSRRPSRLSSLAAAIRSTPPCRLTSSPPGPEARAGR